MGPIAVYNCTNKCGQKCLHCYSRAGDANGELDTNQAKRLLDNLAEIKCSVVLFSGGEPLERPDIFELFKYASNIGLRAAISSNGNLISAGIAKKIADAGVSYVGISIDGMRETHDRFRGVAGSFDKAINGIKACKDVGVKAGIRFTMTNRNFNQINEIFSIAEQLGIARICFYHLISAGRAVDNDLKCSKEQVRQALNDILTNAKIFSSKGVTEVLTVGNHADGGFILNRLGREGSDLYEKTHDLLEKFGGNKIGTKIFAVDAGGNVHPDQFWRDLTMGNVGQQNLREILGNYFDIFNNKTKMLEDVRCKKCKWLKICGTNMRNGVLEPGCYLNDEEI
jgi:radical SAM protein with 4Fe4S-binding SPASM domain